MNWAAEEMQTAAYRFFANDNVNAEKMLQPYLTETIARIQHCPIMLCIQDTTTTLYLLILIIFIYSAIG